MKKLIYSIALLSLLFVWSCGDDDGETPAPSDENPEEIITDVNLNFTPDGGGSVITASAQDPDGDGPTPLQVVGDIELVENTTYTLTMELFNSEDPDDIELVTAEISAEDDEHMFFFGWSDGLFGSPVGDGNIDSRADEVNYNDQDANGFPVGLSTSWSTDETGSGTFTVLLKHQPDGIKTATSSSTDGDTDVDITWNIVVGEDPDAPGEENPEEIITDVTLTFTTAGGTAITATAQDPDGEGPLGLEVVSPIELVENTAYTMTMELLNAEDPADIEDITEEIQEEDAEHMFFFAWTQDLFGDPTGDGNVDGREDAVNYNDQDAAGFPVGLSTAWTTDEPVSGTFQVILKHQPDGIKTATSTSNDGDTDIDITWDITVVEDPDAPGEENPEEIITDVTLTFTAADGTAVTATAQDPDGEGPLALEVVTPVALAANTTYTLTMELLNAEDPNDVEDITEEIANEDNEHMFFFAWTADYFSDPAGDGNIDSRDDALNYADMDAGGLPVGLTTTWTTGNASTTDGEFRVVLKHQPDGIKTATSTATDGDSDIDITWALSVN